MKPITLPGGITSLKMLSLSWLCMATVGSGCIMLHGAALSCKLLGLLANRRRFPPPICGLPPTSFARRRRSNDSQTESWRAHRSGDCFHRYTTYFEGHSRASTFTRSPLVVKEMSKGFQSRMNEIFFKFIYPSYTPRIAKEAVSGHAEGRPFRATRRGNCNEGIVRHGDGSILRSCNQPCSFWPSSVETVIDMEEFSLERGK